MQKCFGTMIGLVSNDETIRHANTRYAYCDRETSDPLTLYRCAENCRADGEVDLWLEYVDRALRLPHVTQEQIYHRGMAKLTLGDWSGWSDIRAKTDHPQSRSRYARLLRWRYQEWNGAEDLSDKSLFVYLERGFGDGLQMLRFVPALVDSAKSVILAVRPELAGLVFHNLDRRVQLTLRGWDLPAQFDRYIWSMSLPSYAGMLPPFQPIKAPSPLARPMNINRPLRVGLCWAGSQQHPRDRNRSANLDDLSLLFDRHGMKFVSLQVGPRATDAQRFPALGQPPVPLRSFGDTANVIAALDAVVTIDSAVCHLAGSMGTRTFLMLDSAAEFRWGLGALTAWYPTMTIVRQAHRNDWMGVAAAIAEKLTGIHPIAY